MLRLILRLSLTLLFGWVAERLPVRGRVAALGLAALAGLALALPTLVASDEPAAVVRRAWQPAAVPPVGPVPRHDVYLGWADIPEWQLKPVVTTAERRRRPLLARPKRSARDVERTSPGATAGSAPRVASHAPEADEIAEPHTARTFRPPGPPELSVDVHLPFALRTDAVVAAVAEEPTEAEEPAETEEPVVGASGPSPSPAVPAEPSVDTSAKPSPRASDTPSLKPAPAAPRHIASTHNAVPEAGGHGPVAAPVVGPPAPAASQAGGQPTAADPSFPTAGRTTGGAPPSTTGGGKMSTTGGGKTGGLGRAFAGPLAFAPHVASPWQDAAPDSSTSPERSSSDDPASPPIADSGPETDLDIVLDDGFDPSPPWSPSVFDVPAPGKGKGIGKVAREGASNPYVPSVAFAPSAAPVKSSASASVPLPVMLVPEPATAVLLSAGLLALASLRRLR